MPNYNSQSLLDWAISSVYNQTYEDWELIVVDDGSTDPVSKDIISKWKDRIQRSNYRGRMIVAELEINSGSPVRPRNTGLSLSSGNYVAFLDSDDRWYSDKLEKQVAFMESSAFTFSYHDMDVVKEDEKKTRRYSQMSKPYDGFCFEKLLYKNFIASSSVMLDYSLFRCMNIYPAHDPSLTISHDWNLWLQIAHRRPIGYIPLVLGSLWMHPGGVTANIRRRRKESREVVRRWKGRAPRIIYTKSLLRYYLIEVLDFIKKFV